MRASLFTTALGAAVGLSCAWALGQELSEEAPSGWTRTQNRALWMSPSTLGPLAPVPQSWSLGGYASLSAEGPLASLTVEADIPPDGELLLQLDSRPDGGGAAILLTDEEAQGVTWRADAPMTPLACTGAASGQTVERTPSGLRLGGLECVAPAADGPAVLRAGLQRVRVKLAPPPQPGWVRLAAAGIGGLLGGLLGLGQSRLRSPRLAVLASLPALICLLALTWDAANLVETLRVIDLPARRLPLLLGLIPAAFAHVAVATGALRRGQLPGTVLALALTGLGVGMLFDATWARIYLGLAGAAVGGIVWLQRNPIRGWNLLSVALVLGALGAVEYALRWSSASQAWGLRNAEGAATPAEDFAALEAGTFRDYPSAGFPVAVGPKRGPRIVCLGGSSTGGAWQNDRLDQFYPARMQTRGEVVNQGVGAWNSLHIRLFLEENLERLDPDVLTVYLGVNEALQLPADMNALYERFQRGALKAPGVDLRLFQGFRLVVLGLRGKTAAVPPEHFEQNLRAIAQRAAPARVLLLSEGVQPRPDGFAAWADAMRQVAAEEPNVAFADSAVALQRLGPVAFLDQNHLSDAGHRALARFIDDTLRDLGWAP